MNKTTKTNATKTATATKTSKAATLNTKENQILNAIAKQIQKEGGVTAHTNKMALPIGFTADQFAETVKTLNTKAVIVAGANHQVQLTPFGASKLHGIRHFLGKSFVVAGGKSVKISSTAPAAEKVDLAAELTEARADLKPNKDAKWQNPEAADAPAEKPAKKAAKKAAPKAGKAAKKSAEKAPEAKAPKAGKKAAPAPEAPAAPKRTIVKTPTPNSTPKQVEEAKAAAYRKPRNIVLVGGNMSHAFVFNPDVDALFEISGSAGGWDITHGETGALVTQVNRRKLAKKTARNWTTATIPDYKQESKKARDERAKRLAAEKAAADAAKPAKKGKATSNLPPAVTGGKKRTAAEVFAV